MRVENTNNPLNGVRCVVNTCSYYANGDHCTASQIEIQCPNASTSSQTDCATFTPKNINSTMK
jgi:hypothetical protein